MSVVRYSSTRTRKTGEVMLGFDLEGNMSFPESFDPAAPEHQTLTTYPDDAVARTFILSRFPERYREGVV